MNERRENFDEKSGGEYADGGVTPRGMFDGPNAYGETNYFVDEKSVDDETLKQFSLNEHADTGPGDFPFGESLREATSQAEFEQIVADLEVFYAAQVKALEGNKPATVADLEVVEFAQALQEDATKKGETGGQPVQEISTNDDALEYIKRPGIIEKLSGNARKLLAIAFSATAFAASMPTNAQGFNFGQFGSYAIQRGVQEGQIEVQARLRLRSIKDQCDFRIQTLENDAGAQIASLNDMTMLRIEDLGLRADIPRDGIDLLASNAAEQFRTKVPKASAQQLAVFAQMRQDALYGKTQARQIKLSSDNQIKQAIRSCDREMKQISQAMSYERTMRVTGDIGNVILMPR